MCVQLVMFRHHPTWCLRIFLHLFDSQTGRVIECVVQVCAKAREGSKLSNKQIGAQKGAGIGLSLNTMTSGGEYHIKLGYREKKRGQQTPDLRAIDDCLFCLFICFVILGSSSKE